MTQLLKCCFSFNTDIHNHKHPIKLPSPQNFWWFRYGAVFALSRLSTATRFSLSRQIASDFFFQISLFLIFKPHHCEQWHNVYAVTVSVMDFLVKDFFSKITYSLCWFRMVFGYNALFPLALNQQRKASC